MGTVVSSQTSFKIAFWKVRPDQINMAVLFWYLVKSDAIVFATYSIHYTYTGQVTFNKVSDAHGHV